MSEAERHERETDRSVGLARAMDMLVVVLFAVAVTMPMAALVFGAESSGRVQENRRLAKPPSIEGDNLASALAAWPSGFDSWFGDHFGLRGRLIEWNTVVTVLWLESSAGLVESGAEALDAVIDPLARTVFKGQGDWFYYFGKGMFDDHRGLSPLSDGQLEEWRRAFEWRQMWLAEKGIDYLLVIVPEKQTIYPEHLPRAVRREGPTRAQQIAAHLREQSGVHVLELRPALERAKAEQRVYHRTGSHWNAFGAHRACQRIIEELSKRHGVLSPAEDLDFEIRTEQGPARALMSRVGLASWLREEMIVVEPRSARRARVVSPWRPEGAPRHLGSILVEETGRSELPRAVVVHDSFTAVALGDLLSEHFERTAYYWMRQLPRGTIEAEQPDVLIEERVERAFVPPPPQGSEIYLEEPWRREETVPRRPLERRPE